MQELDSLRSQIDDIDNQLLELLARRQDVVKMVGEFKSRHNIPVFDKAREDYLYEFHQKLSVKYNLSFAFIEDLFAMIMEHSRKTQRELK